MIKAKWPSNVHEDLILVIAQDEGKLYNAFSCKDKAEEMICKLSLLDNSRMCSRRFPRFSGQATEQIHRMAQTVVEVTPPDNMNTRDSGQ